MRALWVEDHALIGDSLEMLLQVLIPDISLDKARSLDAAREMVLSIPYELLLVDWWLGSQDGETTIRALRKAGSACPVIVVSADERDAVWQQAKALDVAAFVSKSTDSDALVRAIQDVVQRGMDGRKGDGFLVPSRGGQSGSGAAAQPPLLDVQQVFPELTPRQADVFRGLMRGLSDKHIARELSISETTVKTHVRAILQTVGASKRGEAVFLARNGGAGEG